MKYAWLMICLHMVLYSWGQLPQGFENTLFSDDVPGITNLEFAENGNIYACSLRGQLWLFEDGQTPPQSILDISDEVAGFAELGCLSFTLHPRFMENGYVYMFYVVDRHHLLYYGTENYDPEANLFEEATIGRVTRFTVSTDDYRTVLPGSRKVLFGDSIGEGNPALTISHGTGDIFFGSDGTLLFSTGDGNTFENDFAGGDEEPPSTAYDHQALEDGIISEAENVGAFRAQQVQSYSGKVLRIDAETGEGIVSNPYFDADQPDAPASKIWALGLRNPYRIALRPGTGSTDPSEGNPGTLYITDVGASSWEEINVSDGPGYNFGWPVFEGMQGMWFYMQKDRANKFVSNPLTEGCERDFFTFMELIQQENGNHDYKYPHPCFPSINIADTTQVYYHTRPVLTYRNDSWNPGGRDALLPTFDGEGKATELEITAPGAQVEGAESFGGISAITGDFYDGIAFPEEYHQMLPVIDYDGWLKVFWFDQSHRLQKMEHWLSGLENVIDMRFNPYDGCYYMTSLFPSEIRKICFAGNLRPQIKLDVSPEYGPGPLEVTFDASATFDPEDDPISFEWALETGETDTGSIVSHIFTPDTQAPQSFYPTLTVRDSNGNVATQQIHISVNNSPPQVDIHSISPDQLYPMDRITQLPLEATVEDAEHAAGELDFEWVTYLHHNTHFHPLTESEDPQSIFSVNPVGCEEVNNYYYRISLRVTDPEGLEGYDERYIFPDCDGTLIDSVLSLRVYPNPTSDFLYLRFSDEVTPEQDYTIHLFNMEGRQVLEGVYPAHAFQHYVRLKVSHLLPGTYIYQARSEEGEQYIGRFIISSR